MNVHSEIYFWYIGSQDFFLRINDYFAKWNEPAVYLEWKKGRHVANPLEFTFLNFKASGVTT